MKVYIAYEGYYNRHDRQDFVILGVYRSKDEAVTRIQKSIGSLEGIDVETRGSTTWWIERGLDIVTVGKLEEHELIEEYEEPVKGIDFTKINPMDLAFTVEELEGLKKI